MGRISKLLKEPRTLGLSAVVSAVGVCSLALVLRGGLLLRAPAPPAAEPVNERARVATPPPTSDPRQVGEQVLTRNIFDSETGALAWQLTSPADVAGPDAPADTDAGAVASNGPCPGELRLLASVVHGRDPSRSLAAVRKDEKTHFLALGEQLDELTLVALHPTEAWFRHGAMACSLPVYVSVHNPAPAPLTEPPPPPPEPLADGTPPPPGRKPPAFSEEELKRNIRVLGPTRYAVTRELFTRARMNPSGISRGARFKPQLRDGRSAGMEVFVLREDSLLAHLGVKQGDVLRGINGFSLSSADGMLEAMGHLGKQSQVSLSIERAGALTTIEYVLE